MTKHDIYRRISALEIKRQRTVISAAGQYWLGHIRQIDQQIDALKDKLARV